MVRAKKFSPAVGLIKLSKENAVLRNRKGRG